MLKTFALSLTAAAALTLGAAAVQPAPASAGDLVVKVHGDAHHWRKEERRWRRAQRRHNGRGVPYPYKRYNYKVHYPNGCYYKSRQFRVRSLGPYGWYNKVVWRPVHTCR